MIEQNYESKSCIDRIKELERKVNSDNRNGCMTTLELIEKYGIGHNCLSDAYALGMMHGLDGMEHAVEFAEKKTRVDVIDECIEILKDTSRRNCSHILDEIVYRAVEQMENLKWQKNEHDAREEADIWLGKKSE